MDKQRTSKVSSKPDSGKTIPNKRSLQHVHNEAAGDNNSQDSSHTQYFRRGHGSVFKKLSRKEIFKLTHDTMETSGSSDTFQCVHGPEGKQYTEEEMRIKFLTQQIDPILIEQSWGDPCPFTEGWEITKTLEFMVKDPVANQQVDRLRVYLRNLAQIAKFGYKIDILDNLTIIMDYLVEHLSPEYPLREEFVMLLHNMNKPILLNASSDVVTYFRYLTNYINFMGYLLLCLAEDNEFDIVSNALIWHLSCPDCYREQGNLTVSFTLAAATGLCETVVRMLALSTLHRFPTFLEIAFLLACDNVDNYVNMMRNNIIENVFHRFNPYFPDRDLPIYEIGPANVHDLNVKLGASSIHMPSTLSLLLVLSRTGAEIRNADPNFFVTLPCPDSYSQRCFAWAYRYECRARDHRHERISLTIVASSLLHCFGERLNELSNALMLDVLSLSVRTEVPVRHDWTGSVNFNTGQQDVHFKQVLIYLSVDFLKTFPDNIRVIESRHWLLGLMYLLDPVLCELRAHWSSALFADLRKTAFKALICTLPLASPRLVQEYGLIRRLMWYVEWYSVSPYDRSILYWCLRLLQVAIGRRNNKYRRQVLQDLFDSHGIIIIIRLCHTLLDQKSLPVEKTQVIICVCLRLLTSATEMNSRVSCCVYPNIKWPTSVQTLSARMLSVVLSSLQKNLLISHRWLIALLNFIWEAVIWNDTFRAIFVAEDGVYKLLDIISVSTGPVQCLGLALLCDVARAGDAVGQIITWRAGSSTSYIIPNLVKRGATIANLLAAIFKDECLTNKVEINSSGVIQNLDCPLMPKETREQIHCLLYQQYFSCKKLTTLPASDLAGSRMSKVFAVLYMLSKDLAFKVSLADETYNLYKNIKLPPQDETVLLLCSHYLTIKLNETWFETNTISPPLLPKGAETLAEFSAMTHGWAKKIKQMQEDIIAKSEKEDYEVECSFYEFLGRVRLNIALDGLREVRCMARSSDRFQISHSLLHDAVMAQKRRWELSQTLNTSIKKTYTSPLDTKNVIGQHIKVTSIETRQIPVKKKTKYNCHKFSENKK